MTYIAIVQSIDEVGMPTEIAMIAALVYSMIIVIAFGATFFYVYFWRDYDE